MPIGCQCRLANAHLPWTSGGHGGGGGGVFFQPATMNDRLTLRKRLAIEEEVEVEEAVATLVAVVVVVHKLVSTGMSEARFHLLYTLTLDNEEIEFILCIIITLRAGAVTVRHGASSVDKLARYALIERRLPAIATTVGCC
ncbi:hypothetical protein T10_4894 [Trichinella papuae]|uniref:Uncharacterized protein n=1 Tax=Trichinella papuae TaxID=268474 RepID=A0A0V1NAC8_9BILA|nr:hypothetical protein T10_4894 [Trichinella papuae]